jgi:hypothetical protein
VDLKPKLDLLRDHGKSKRHLDKGPLLNMKVSKLPFRPVNVVPDEVKKLELKLTAMAVCHTSFNTMDHISEILKEEGKGSTMEKIKLHRTKENQAEIVDSKKMLTVLLRVPMYF